MTTHDRNMKTYLKSNGTLRITRGWRWAWIDLTITGGPFRHFDPAQSGNPSGLCLLERRMGTATHWLPIEDFSVPEDDAQVRDVIETVVGEAMRGADVYVGCMGGWGRTGLVLALIAKALGEEDPVGFVRANYTPHAVETDEQKAYVDGFDTSDLTKTLQRMAWRTLVKRLFGN